MFRDEFREKSQLIFSYTSIFLQSFSIDIKKNVIHATSSTLVHFYFLHINGDVSMKHREELKARFHQIIEIFILIKSC